MKIRLTVLGIVLAGFFSCQEQGPAFRSAQEIHDAIGVGWNLGNTLEAYDGKAVGLETETSWGNPRSSREMIHKVKEAGFNAIRIPVRWYPHMGENDRGESVVDTEWMDRVGQIVDWCLEEDLITIINTHHELWLESHPFYADSAQVLKKERQLWAQVAGHFRDYDDRLLFAGTNEVHLPGQWGQASPEQGDMQNVFNQVFVNTVRETGGNNRNRNLVVQTYYCAPVHNAGLFVAPEDPAEDHLLVEVHLYEPSTYAMLGIEKYWGAEYLDDIFSEEVPASLPQASPEQIKAYLAGKRQNPETDEERMEKLFAGIRESLGQWNLPIILGECGASRWPAFDADGTDRKAASRRHYHENLIRISKENGMAPFLWDNGDTGVGTECFGLFDRKNGMKGDKMALEGIMKGLQ